MGNTAARFVLAGTLGTLFCSAASAQVGHIVGAQKISDTSGGFTALLDEEDQFGRSIVNLGDLDGDGVTDLLVGAHTDDDGGIDQGSVYILFLRANGAVKDWAKISDASGNFANQLDPGDQFGRAAASVGDLDEDGVVDVVVSSNYDDDGGANKGAIYVLFLQADGTVKSTQKISQTTGGLPITLKIHDEFGRSITPLGDLNGDGTVDIVVGTPEDDDGGTNTGALHVLFLNHNGTVKQYKRISRSTDGLKLKPGDWFGHCSANLGDFDHDGVTDLVVGSVLDDDGSVNQGSIWILYLNANGSVKESHEINELFGGFNVALDDIDQFGTSVANIGDLDGDGVTDIAVGAVKDDDGGLVGNPDADVGAVYVLFLKSDATVKSVVKISDTEGDLPYALDQYDWFGSALCRLGGSPGDGLLNLAIGCRNDDDGSPNRGSVYLVQLNDGTAPFAQFTANKTLGVAPMTVSFTDTSINEVTAYVWSFGDGSQSSLRNPVKTYSTPGVYDVALNTKGPRGRDTETKHAFITVSAGPLADFTAATTSGLAPLDVAFTDLSEGQVTARTWDFGDGATSTAAAPHHVYAPGTYTVAFTVQGPNGFDTKTRTSYVTAADLAPLAAFDATPASGVAPLAVQFDDHSTGVLTAWSWAFGDGATATGQAPQHVYTQPGSYDVTLTVTGPYGTNTLVRTNAVVVEDPVPAADFSAVPSVGFTPLPVQFTDLSTGNVTQWSWDFGDGTTGSETDPLHVYENSGTFTVVLTVSGPNGSAVRTRDALVVASEAPPVAEFLVPSTIGFAPFTAQFTDQSSGTVSTRVWSFGDGSHTNLPNPQHVYDVPGIYTVSLDVSGPYGSDSEVKTALIDVRDSTPVADFNAPQTSGLAPLVVQFADASDGDVTAWAWEFGDGATSTERDPEHVYALPGSYDVRLSVGGPTGTDDESRAAFVVVSTPPTLADFGAVPTSGPAPLVVQFADQSHGILDTWSWDFGDGTTSSDASPQHTYTTPGTYGVRLTVAGAFGSDVEEKSAFVQVQVPAPTPEFVAGPASGFAPLPVAFTDLSTGGVTSWSWAFGDGTTSKMRFPVKVYNRTGVFTATLTVKGPGGTRSIARGPIAVVAKPVLSDGGFELQTAGLAPAAPWSIFAGTGSVVRSSALPDTGFPREGTRWLEVEGTGSVAATAPPQPRGPGELPTGVVGVAQTFAFQPLAPHLAFDAAFLLGDQAASAANNDFMSVDVTDGTNAFNLFYADSFGALPALSTTYGLPMSAVERVHVDLRTLFPAAAAGTQLTLRIGVGNGGDAANPSRGYVDAFRFVPTATATPRNGTGRNAMRYAAGPPVLGGTWTIQVDTTGHTGARSAQIVLTQRPASGTIRAAGEVLTSGAKLFSQAWVVRPGLNTLTTSIPLDLNLMGLYAASQVTISGGKAELCNAYDLVLGL